MPGDCEIHVVVAMQNPLPSHAKDNLCHRKVAKRSSENPNQNTIKMCFTNHPRGRTLKLRLEVPISASASMRALEEPMGNAGESRGDAPSVASGLFVGRVLAVGASEAAPLLYTGRRYGRPMLLDA